MAPARSTMATDPTRAVKLSRTFEAIETKIFMLSLLVGCG
jgi:hypothetical protein